LYDRWQNVKIKLTSAFGWSNFNLSKHPKLKGIILLLIAGSSFLSGYSQVRKEWHYLEESRVHKEIVFKIPDNRLVVKLYESEDEESTLGTLSTIYVSCRVHCSEWKRSAIREIFMEKVEGKLEQELTVDSLFQILYNWIKEIDDFANNHKTFGDTIKMRAPFYYEPNEIGIEYYKLILYSDHINISTTKFLRDQEGFWCLRWTNLKLQTITKFKNCLIEYIKENNIGIRL
jgi:hypothetical protein